MRRSSIAIIVFLFTTLPAQAHLRLVATTSDLGAIAQAIGKEWIEVVILLPPESDPHDATPELADAAKLKDADLVIAIGLDYEARWLPALLKIYGPGRFRPASGAYLDASTGCDILDAPGNHQTPTGFGGVHPFGNPHYWLDPANGLHIAQSVAARLSALDPHHALDYQTNLRSFQSALAAKESGWESMARALNGMALLSNHATWANFAKAFDLTVEGVIEPWPGTKPDVGRAGEMIHLIRERHVTAILIESYADPGMAQGIATGANVEIITLPTSVGGIPEVPTYLDLIDYNLKTLQEHLQ